MTAAHVRSIGDIEHLRDATVTFAGHAREHLVAAEQDLQRFLRQMQELRDRARAEVRRLTAVVEDCERELHLCARQEDADCSGIQAALARARRAQQQAEERQRLIEHHMDRVLEAGQAYQVQARRLTSVLDQDIPRASAQLNRHVAHLSAYLSMTPGGATPASGAGKAETRVDVSEKQWLADLEADRADTFDREKSEQAIQELLETAVDIQEYKHQYLVPARDEMHAARPSPAEWTADAVSLAVLTLASVLIAKMRKN